MKTLHIISFDVPYPANYGGVIDVFYKLKQLHASGVKIILHCFEYGKGQQPELNKYCEQVYYYKRNTSFRKQLSRLPFIVNSRISEELTQRLLQDSFPILFEGLHTCGIIDDERLAHRYKVYRESNIEHDYYLHLAAGEKNYLRKLYFRIEAKKLARFQSRLSAANKMLVVSQADASYLQQVFPSKDIEYLPSFHPYETVVSQTGSGSFVLYHGNLSVSENTLAVDFLVREVFSKLSVSVVIAGLNPSSDISTLIAAHPNIKLIANPSDEVLQKLIQDAHINCLYTHQATGLKLKLLNALFAGRYCLLNDKMLHGTGLNSACEIANKPQEFISSIHQLMQQPFRQSYIDNRIILLKNYDVRANALRILSLV